MATGRQGQPSEETGKGHRTTTQINKPIVFSGVTSWSPNTTVIQDELTNCSLIDVNLHIRRTRCVSRNQHVTGHYGCADQHNTSFMIYIWPLGTKNLFILLNHFRKRSVSKILKFVKYFQTTRLILGVCFTGQTIGQGIVTTIRNYS